MVGVAMTAARAVAAAPEARYLFPAGGQRGQTVEVTVDGTFGEWPLGAWTDQPELTFSAAAEQGKLTATIGPAAVPGMYWVRLYDSSGAAAPLPFIVGNVAELLDQEPNDEPAAAQPLASGPVVVNGRLERGGDVDVFAVSVRAGQALVADMDANQTLGSPVDAVLQIVSERGTVLAQNDDQLGLDPQIAFVAPSDGTYLVRTFGFPASPGTTIGLAGGESFVYRLTITTGGFVDYTLPLAVQAGSTAGVDLRGWNIPDDARRQAVEPAGDSVAATLFDPQLANAVSIAVEPHGSVVEAEPNGTDQPQRIELPQTVTGVIDGQADRDVFVFAAGQGQALSFQVESRALGFPLDPVLELFDPAGQSLARVDDSGTDRDAQLTHTIAADGDYRLCVSDLHRHGGPRYVYRLRALVAQPDFALSVESHAFTVTAGMPLEIPVAIDRRLGFAEEISLRIDGLPPGVQAAPALSRAADESANSVKVVLTSTGEPHSGAIRIVGEPSGPGAQARTATAAAGSSGARIRDLWLTVLPASQ